MTLQPSVDLPVGDDMPGRAHHDAGAVFDLALGWRTPACDRAGDAGERREGVRHHDHDRVHDGFGRLVVQHGHAAHLAVLDLGAHVEFLQALRARQDERVGLEQACSTLRLGGSFFCCSNTAASVVPGSLIRNVSIWTWPCARGPARAGLALGLVRDLLGRDAEPRAGHRIVDHGPADLRLLGLGGGGEQRALLGVEDAGFLELAVASGTT